MTSLLEEWLQLPDEAARQNFLDQPNQDLANLLAELVAKVDFLCRSNPPQALELAQQGLGVAERLSDSTARGQALRVQANALRALGRPEEALPLYQQALALFRQAENPAEEARTYLGELAALSMLGRYEECLRYGATVRRRLLRLGDRLNLAKLLSTLAIINHQIAHYPSALRLHNRSLKLFQEAGLSEMLPPGQVNRANTLTQLNRFRQAEADYRSSREAFSARGMSALVAVIDVNLGFLLFRQGRYNEAIALLSSARDGFEATAQTDKRALAELDLAFCYSALNLHDEALALCEQAAQTLAGLNMRSEALRVELTRAEILINKAELVQADLCLEEILLNYEAEDASARNLHSLAMAWLYRSILLNRLHPDRNSEALELCRKARHAFSDLKLTYWQAQTLIVEADLLRQASEWNAAQAAYKLAEPAVSRLNLPHLLYQLHYGTGKMYQAKVAQNPEETAQLRSAARQEFLQAADQIETIRAILRPEELRLAFMENGLGAYEALVELCLQETAKPTALKEAFSYVERSKSRTLLDRLSEQLTTSPELAPELTERVRQLRDELNWFYSQVHEQNNLESGQTQRLATLDQQESLQQIEQREQELAKLWRSIRQLTATGEAVEAETIAENLADSQVLLEYYVLHDQVMAFIIGRDSLVLRANLVPIDHVQAVQERLNFQAAKFNLGRAYVARRQDELRRAFDLYLKELHTLLIAPLLPDLQAKRLIIVPHGNLHTLPFHALYDGQRYLIEQFEISYAPSASVWLHTKLAPMRPLQKLLAVAVPDAQLPGVEAEVRNLPQFFPQSQVLVGEQATLANLHNQLQWCDILHLASHGVFRESNPLFSMLKLYDGWLAVHDVLDWQFKPELVVLSACQTGLNRPMAGDELLGLARGFLAAGATALVASIWAVDDEITAILMREFYAGLAQKLNIAAALRRAMLNLLHNPAYSHPHYWAAFMGLGSL